MRKRFLILVVSIASLVPRSGHARADAPLDWRTRLSAAIGRATGENPGVHALEARIDAARRRVTLAPILPDPEVEIGLKDAPVSNPSLSRDDFTMQMVSARQRFPGLGKRAAQEDVARSELASLEAMHEGHVVRLAADVADAFFQIAEIDARVTILTETRQRLESAASSANERYRVGKVAQADVLRANLERTSVDEKLSSLRADRRMQVARFSTLQGLRAEAEVPPIGPVDPELDLPSTVELLRRGEDQSPMIAAAAADVRKAEGDLRLAALEARPDLMVMGYYARRERFEDLAGASISINLPFAHPKRLDERRAEAGALVTAARASLQGAKNDLRNELVSALADLERNREQAALYRESILPQAEINYRSAREAYTVGQIDFLTFIRAATDLSMYELEAAGRRSGIGRALAAVQKASGLALIEGTPRVGGDHEQK